MERVRSTLSRCERSRDWVKVKTSHGALKRCAVSSPHDGPPSPSLISRPRNTTLSRGLAYCIFDGETDARFRRRHPVSFRVFVL